MTRVRTRRSISSPIGRTETVLDLGSDVVADDHLTTEKRAERGDWVGCIAGALFTSEYRDQLSAVGFTDIEITHIHEAAQDMHSAIIRAVKPA